MTLLNQKNLDDCYYFNVHESPYHLNNAEKRWKWIRNSVPCFDKQLIDFWTLYCTPVEDGEKCLFGVAEQRDERRRFIRYPLMTLTDETPGNSHVAGGAWIDDVKKWNCGGVARFHLIISQGHRYMADRFFNEFLKEMDSQYVCLITEWGKRSKSDDPTGFMQRWGFSIKEKVWTKEAIVKLDDIKHLYNP